MTDNDLLIGKAGLRWAQGRLTITVASNDSLSMTQQFLAFENSVSLRNSTSMVGLSKLRAMESKELLLGKGVFQVGSRSPMH